MSAEHRIELELSTDERDAIDRIGQLAKLSTKAVVLHNGFALLNWAATQVLAGRTICSIDDETGTRIPLELPSLVNVAEVRARNPLLPAERYLERAGNGRPLRQLLEHLKGLN